MEEGEAWSQAVYSAEDMEAVANFAVTQRFGMDRTSILYTFDNPTQKEHLLLNDTENGRHHIKGNRQRIEMVLEMIGTFAGRITR